MKAELEEQFMLGIQDLITEFEDMDLSASDYVEGFKVMQDELEFRITTYKEVARREEW